MIGNGPIYTAVDIDASVTSWASVAAIDLPANAFGKQVRLEFRLTGNGGELADFLGWYIDNILVEGF